MPVYEQSYRHWHGVLNPKTQQWFIIAQSGIKMLWRKWMIILVAFASIPFTGRNAHRGLEQTAFLSSNQQYA